MVLVVLKTSIKMSKNAFCQQLNIQEDKVKIPKFSNVNFY